MTAIIFGAAGLLCLLYYLIIIIYAGITADFAWIWILLAVVFGTLSFSIYLDGKHPGIIPGWVRVVVASLLAIGLIIFSFLCSKVIGGMSSKGSKNLDYVIILGAHVKGEAPSKALEKRLQCAVEYAQENPNTILILSGAQGSGEDITEAECMRRYLTAKGISESRLVMEERSTTTKENLMFSDELSGCSKKRTGIISNNFHIYRSLRLAEKLGYLQAEGIAAKSDPLMQVHYVVRETVALVKEKIVGNIN